MRVNIWKSELMTKQSHQKFWRTKANFFREKLGFLEEKEDFFLKFLRNLYKFDLGFSWVCFIGPTRFFKNLFWVATLLVSKESKESIFLARNTKTRITIKLNIANNYLIGEPFRRTTYTFASLCNTVPLTFLEFGQSSQPILWLVFRDYPSQQF